MYVINGEMYKCGREDEEKKYKGFCGQKFYIRQFDGFIISTTNLIHMGKTTTLENNAEFLDDYN